MASSILVVDDDAAVRGLTVHILTSRGHVVLGQAGSVAEALKLAADLRPDVVLVDIGLPDGDGFSLTRQLRARPWPVRVVLFSSDADRPLRVVIGEDDVLLREGIARILTEADLDVVARSGDADDLLRRGLAYRPDVLATDVRMPPRGEDDGLRAAMELRRREPGIGVLILSQYCEPGYAMELVGQRHEGVGYLLKERVGDLRVFVDAITRVAAGGSALDPEVVGRMLGRRALRRSVASPQPPREGRAGGDGRGDVQPRYRPEPLHEPGLRREARHGDIPQGCASRPRRPTTAGCMPCLRTCGRTTGRE